MSPPVYISVAGDETDGIGRGFEEELSLDSYEKLNDRSPWLYRALLACSVITCCLFVTVLVAAATSFVKITPTSLNGCLEPAIRREWRTLWDWEKKEYIDAVLCLQNTLSSLTGQGTLHDDFVYVHMLIGAESHDAASFLPWHRAFLHIYESTLIEKCGYQGAMPYWNWEVDWRDIANSSMWSSENGFGGDGDINGELSLGLGRCVIDGPFKHHHPLYFNGDKIPHCLSRGFIHHGTNESGTIDGEWFSPEQMGRLRRMPEYKEFEKFTETGFHNALHWGIGGDFTSYTAANDPVFWLHHAQLDRLWWQWQQEDPEVRNSQYYGKSFNTTWGMNIEGTLEDDLRFLNMSRVIKIKEVMQTNGGLLCYKYA